MSPGRTAPPSSPHRLEECLFVPTNKQRREAAQRHLQRQLQRRAEQARKRRRNLLIGSVALTVLVVAGAAAIIAGIGTGNPRTAAAGSSTAAGSTAAGDGTDGNCAYTKDSSGNPNLKDVGTPPSQVPTSGSTAVTMTTNFGAVPLTLDHAEAPCATESFVYLAQKKFFDNTICHRETSSEGLKVLQCGDPSGTGSGGPSYQYKTHVTGKETYPRGTIAMANSGQGFDGSQFFLVYGNSQLPPNYTVIGTISAPGLKVLDTIAANGNDGANGPGDGAPKKKVTITSMTVGTTTSAAATSSAP
jgi:peptidyl-prolyl cis-trans isomerase B (cyclophilin B)